MDWEKVKGLSIRVCGFFLCALLVIPCTSFAQGFITPPPMPPPTIFFGGGSSSSGFISSPSNTPTIFFGGGSGTSGSSAGGTGGTGTGSSVNYDFSESDFDFLDAESSVVSNVSMNVENPRQFPSLPVEGGDVPVAPPQSAWLFDEKRSTNIEDWNTGFSDLLLTLNHRDKAQFRRENIDLDREKGRRENRYGRKRLPYIGTSYFYVPDNVKKLFTDFVIEDDEHNPIDYETVKTMGFKNYFYQRKQLVATAHALARNDTPERIGGWLMYRSSQMGANVVLVGRTNVRIVNCSVFSKRGFKFPVSIGFALGKAVGLTAGAPSERYTESSTETRPYMADVLFLRLKKKEKEKTTDEQS